MYHRRTIKIALGAAVLAAAIGIAPAAWSDELITNGSFDTAPPSSTGSFTYCGAGPYSGCLTPGSHFYLGHNTADIGLGSVADHTGNGGFLALVDPNGTGDFFNQTFAVAPNSDYAISFFAQSLNFGTTLQAVVNGTVIGTPFAPSAGAWTHFTGTYNSGSSNSVSFSLQDTNTAFSYNDFAVDDISFVGRAGAGAVPEPASWALMLAGFGVVGYAMRRRANRTLSCA